MGTELDNMELEAGDRLECTVGFSFFTTGAIYQIDENLWITDDDGDTWGPNSFMGHYPTSPEFKLLGPVQALTTRADLDVDIEFENSRILTAARPRLIGLAGRAGSGKSLAAQTLMNHGFTRVKFADPLKNALRAILKTSGMSDDEIERRIEGDLKEEVCGVLMCTPRHAMQTLGQEWGRQQIDPKFWVSLWRRRVHQLLEEGHDVVVDDVRYENEAALINGLGGYTYLVDRGQASVPTHASEDFNFTVDGAIINRGTKADLIQHIKDRFLS